MIYVGIDPGKSGGIAALNEKKEIIHLEPMPLIGGEIDPHAIAKALALLSVADMHVFIEHCQAMPKQGVSGVFKYGFGFGLLVGICASSAYPMTLVKPQAWQKVMCAGADASAAPKDRAAQVVYRLFPKAELRASPRCRKDHDGLVDALLISAYGKHLLTTVKDP